MKQRKLLGTLAIALTLVLTACGGGGNNGGSSKKATHKHEYEETSRVPATCTEAGKIVYTCKNSDGLCTKLTKEETIPAAGHKFAEGDADVKTNVVEAECEKAGSYDHVCTVCGQTIHETVPALEHQWAKAESQEGAVAPTCTEAGTEIQECGLCHSKQTVKVGALGHDFDETGTDLEQPDPAEKNFFNEDTFHWAKITNYSCKREDSFRYAWSAKEVNFDYKNVAEGAEPELLDDGDGIRFFGRPICNAMELNAQGDAANRGDTPKVPDPSVKGSRFEFDFEFDKDLEDVCLSAEFTPAQYCSDVFKNGDNTEDWTPGYKNVELDPEHPGVHYTAEEIAAAVEGDDAYGKTVEDWKEKPQYTGEIIKPFRFIIYLDGEEVVLDKNVSTQANGRGWYQFPCRLNLTKGKHNLNIAMAGGYRHVFYQFSFEKLAPAHEHKYGVETAQTDEAESKIAQCVSEDATRIQWSAQKFNAAASEIETPNSTENGSTGIKFGGATKGYNVTPNADPNTGDHVVYNVNVPEAQTSAQLYMRFNRKDKVVAFSAPSGDQAPSYVLDPATGKTTDQKFGWRYKLFVNDVEVEFTPYTTDNPEPQTVAKQEVEFPFPCTFALKQGVNKIELQKWGGYTATIVNFSLIY